MAKIVIAIIIFILILVLRILYVTKMDGPVCGDMTIALCAADQLVSGQDPYGTPCQFEYRGNVAASYPLTAAVVMLPFVAFSPWSGCLAFATFSAIMAYGLIRDGRYWRLMVFISLPYVNAFQLCQWSPLALAAYFLPGLMPLALAKPQLALPTMLSRPDKARLFTCAAFVALPFLLVPDWPWRWLPQTGHYDGYIPLLCLPFGPLLFLSLLRWRNRDARLLFVMSLMPQRWLYDHLLLRALPSSPRDLLALIYIEWFAVLLPSRLGVAVPYPHVLLLGAYLPALWLVLRPLDVWRSWKAWRR